MPKEREQAIMIIGILGLGLIGGSLARAIRKKTRSMIFASDTDERTMTEAANCGVVDEPLTTETISRCGIILLAVSPAKAIEWMRLHAGEISRGTLVIDMCGVKRTVCDSIRPLSHEHGFTFIGGHPMAGRERGGFWNSSAELFEGASMLLTPEPELAPETLEQVRTFFVELGFASVIMTSPEEHDRIIAFTSQLPHVISSAFIKSPLTERSAGFTGGSFRDMTRVARADAELWTELFMLNRDFLLEQIETLTQNLNAYRDALKANDYARMKKLIRGVK